MKNWIYISTTLVIAVITISGIYYWQSFKSEETLNKMDATNLSLDPSSKDCTERVAISNELYGDQMSWPLVEKYYSAHSTSPLGTLFAAATCGKDSITQIFPSGKNESGIYATIYPGPSKEFETTLVAAGFELKEKGPKYSRKCDYQTGPDGKQVTIEESCKSVETEGSDHETWALTKRVDITLLIPLRAFANENWSSVWGGLNE